MGVPSWLKYEWQMATGAFNETRQWMRQHFNLTSILLLVLVPLVLAALNRVSPVERVEGLAVTEELVIALIGVIVLVLVALSTMLVKLRTFPSRYASKLEQRAETAEAQVSTLETPKLIVSNGSSILPDVGSYWIRLRVHNPTGLPIVDCYGVIRKYKYLAESGVALPPDGQRLPWNVRAGPREYKRTLEPGVHDFIDIARSESRNAAFRNVRVEQHAGDAVARQVFDWGMPKGRYEAEIDVGSRDTPPVTVIVRMNLTMDDEWAHVEVETKP